MSQRNEPRLSVPSQATLDAAIRNAREERAEVLHLLTRTLVRSVAALWNRGATTGRTGATAGCS